MVGDTRQGWALWAASFVIVVIGLAVALPIEQRGNPLLAALGVDQSASALQAGGNMEGKEVRFGIAALGALGRHHDRRPRAARSTPSTTA